MFEIPFNRKGFGDRGLNLSTTGALAEDLPEMVMKLVMKVEGIKESFLNVLHFR